MAVPYPAYVEEFIERTRSSLRAWNANLILDDEGANGPGRSYRVETPFGVTKLMLVRVGRPSGVPDYRARACTTLPKEYDAVFRGCETIPNRFAALGAYISGREAPAVWSQCVIHKGAIATEAGTMAAAMVHAALSITETLRMKAMEEAPERFAADSRFGKTSWQPTAEVSAWSEPDFQRLERKRPEFRIDRAGERRWIVSFSGSEAFISLAAIDDDRYWGGGLSSLLRMPNGEVEAQGEKVRASDLNFVDLHGGEAPTFGAWCEDRCAYDESRYYDFVSFAPNVLKALPDFTEHFVEWAIIRARTIKQRFQLMLATQSRQGSIRAASSRTSEGY
jgi:hypothetical protein